MQAARDWYENAPREWGEVISRSAVGPSSDILVGHMDQIYKARQFRERAVELRKVAFGLESEQGQESLLSMADEYESIAARIENQKPD